MADNESKAQKNIGGLFVDLGLKGLSGMVKGLNSVSANFLLAKNSAEQAIKPIANLSKTAGNNILDLEKASMTMSGTSVESLYRLQQFAKANHANFSTVLGDIKGMQQALIDIRRQGGGQFFSLIGIDPTQLDWTKPFETMELLINRINKIADPSTRAYAYNMLHISEETQFLYEKGTRTLDRYNSLSKEQLGNLEEQGKKWNKLNTEVDVLKDKLLSSGPISQGIQYLIEVTEGWHDIIDDTNGVWTNFKQNIQDTHPLLYGIYKLMIKIGKVASKYFDKTQKELEDKVADWNAKENLKNGMGASIPEIIKNNIKKEADISHAESRTPLGIIKGITPGLNRIQSIVRTIHHTTVDVKQYINSTDPIEAGQESSNRLQQEMNNLANNNGGYGR